MFFYFCVLHMLLHLWEIRTINSKFKNNSEENMSVCFNA